MLINNRVIYFRSFRFFIFVKYKCDATRFHQHGRKDKRIGSAYQSLASTNHRSILLRPVMQVIFTEMILVPLKLWNGASDTTIDRQCIKFLLGRNSAQFDRFRKCRAKTCTLKSLKTTGNQTLQCADCFSLFGSRNFVAVFFADLTLSLVRK